MMRTRKLIVKEGEGFHVGPCYELSRRAKRYSCDITVWTKRGAFDAKSGLQMLEAGMMPGERVELCYDGTGAEEADEALDSFLLKYFDRDEEDETCWSL